MQPGQPLSTYSCILAGVTVNVAYFDSSRARDVSLGEESIEIEERTGRDSTGSVWERG